MQAVKELFSKYNTEDFEPFVVISRKLKMV
jgi:hypothetical protein